MKNRRKYKTTFWFPFIFFFLRKYDFIRLKIKGKKILSQQYIIVTTIDNKYKWMRLIWTQNMVDDLKNFNNIVL